MPIEIRHQQDSDAEQVREVVSAAFADGGHVADLVTALRARPDVQASLVATADDRVVGHTHLSVSWLDAPTRLVQVLTLSPLAVTPAYQSRGIGARLLDAALASARDLHAPMVFLEGDPAYYSRRGWRPGAEFGCTPPSARIPEPAFQVVALTGHDPGTMTGRLIYNDTFWTFDCVGLRS